MGAIATISEDYEIVIPPEIRDQFNLMPGQRIAFVPYEKSIRLIIVPPIEEARGMFQGMNIDNLREEEDEER